MIRISLSILLLSTFISLKGQHDISGRKHNTVVIAGKRYVIHIVKRGETLFNISKVYDVAYDSITKANPFVIPAALEIGSALKIPYNEPIVPAEPKKTQVVLPFEDSLPIHIVKPGETVFRISLLYNIKPADIFALNPGSDISIQPGQKLKLPKHADDEIVEIEHDADYIYHTVQDNENLSNIAQRYGLKLKILQKLNPKVDANKLETNSKIKIPKHKVEVQTGISIQPDTSTWHYHLVKPKETLFGLSKLYEITQTEIKKYNPALNERELLSGEVLKLPVMVSKPETTSPIVEIAKDTAIQGKAISTNKCLPNPKNDKIRIGLILPFYTNVNDTIAQTGTFTQVFSRSKQFIEFYQGLLLALKDLKENKLVAELYVFDSQNDQGVVQEICNSREFKELDLIIGPAFSRNIEIVSSEAKKYNIPIVSPLSTDETFLNDYENAFMVSPSQKVQEEESIRFISSLKSNNYVVVFDGNQYDSTYIPKLKQQIFSQFTPSTIHNLKYTEFAYFKGGETQLLELFSTNDTTVIIIPSNDQAFVSDIVARLNTLTSQRNLILFGQPRWSRFENIKLEFFHNLNTHLFALSFPKYSEPQVVEFISKYRAFYNTEPQPRAYEGYDITKYFVEAIQKFGKDFRYCLDEHHPNLLHMQFLLRQLKSGSGYINHHLFLVHYQSNFERSVITIE